MPQHKQIHHPADHHRQDAAQLLPRERFSPLADGGCSVVGAECRFRTAELPTATRTSGMRWRPADQRQAANWRCRPTAVTYSAVKRTIACRGDETPRAFSSSTPTHSSITSMLGRPTCRVDSQAPLRAPKWLTPAHTRIPSTDRSARNAGRTVVCQNKRTRYYRSTSCLAGGVHIRSVRRRCRWRAA